MTKPPKVPSPKLLVEALNKILTPPTNPVATNQWLRQNHLPTQPIPPNSYKTAKKSKPKK